jgi:dihydrofolate synthase/folylpolyglutamate synthase
MADQIKTFSLYDWLNYLLVQHQKCHDRDIDRLRPIANNYDLLHFDCPVVVVTGTNGKGSCIKLLDSIYKAEGYRVAAYTSPHCFDFNERISINGVPASNAEIINAFTHIEAVLGGECLRYFEFITLAALYIFKQKALDVILLEVGVGGRLDPANLIDADLTILTTIGIDHTELLGNDLAAIATEKTALFRANRPAICGELSPPSNVFDYAKQLNTPLYWIHRDFEYAYNLEQRSWHWQMGDVEYHGLPIPQIKLQNAATALAATVVLRNSLPIKKRAIVEGLTNTALKGRFEILEPPYRCIVDVAHNRQAAEWLTEQLQQLNVKGKIRAVFAMLTGKDVSAIIQCIKPLIAAWYVCPLYGFTRASAHQEIISTLQAEGVAEYAFFPSVDEAYSSAKAAAASTDCVLVFGSFHMLAPMKAMHST